MESGKNSVIVPVLAALAAALIGGAVWALIVVSMEYELGIVAWAIGGLAAFAVAKTARAITPLHQGVAVVASLLGILLGKYFAYAHILAGGVDGIFNGEIFGLFTENIKDMFGGMDIVFVLLAVVTAWQLPVKLAQQKKAPVEPGTPAQ